MNPYRTIGQRLQRARERAGFTQPQVAGYLGVKREQISQLENGHRKVDVITLTKLADLYGYSVAHFVDQVVPEESDTSIAFRAQNIGDEDLESLRWINRFARNLSELTSLIERRSTDA
ncbi:MAG: helix-turn-helix domain-containing protein [Bacillota bacterium]